MNRELQRVKAEFAEYPLDSDVLTRERERVGPVAYPRSPRSRHPDGAPLCGTNPRARKGKARAQKAVNWCEVRYCMMTFLLLVDLLAFAGVSAIFFSMAVAGKRGMPPLTPH
jgi:hypothetical protein